MGRLPSVEAAAELTQAEKCSTSQMAYMPANVSAPCAAQQQIKKEMKAT